MRPLRNIAANTNRLSKGERHSNFRFLFWNAGGLTPEKFSEFQFIISDLDVDAYGIVEASSAADKPDEFQNPGYRLYTLPRSRQIACGVLIGVKTSLTSKMTIKKTMVDSDLLEAVELELWRGKCHRRFFIVYNPPRNKPQLRWLEETWDDECIAIGDFNAHSTRWGYSVRDATGEIIEQFIDSNPVEFIDNEQEMPTFVSYSGSLSHPDLVLAHVLVAPMISHTLVGAPGGAGHKALLVDSHTHLTNRPKKNKWARWNLKKANWTQYRKMTDLTITADILNGNVDQCFRDLQQLILSAAQKCIPRGTVKTYKPFWTPWLRQLKEERDHAKSEAERLGTPEAMRKLREKYAKFREALKAAKRESYTTYLKNLDYKRDGVRAHRFLSKLNSEPEKPKNPFLINGRELTEDKAIANAFCKQYARVSNFHPKKRIKKRNISPTVMNEEDHQIFFSPFTYEEMEYALNRMTLGKSAGPDRILPEFLIKLGKNAKTILREMLNHFWIKGVIPAEWKKGEIIPILKKGKPADKLESFRPISLTSVVCKLMERLVLSRMTRYFDKKNLISPNQAGFQEHRSTMDHITQLTQMIKDGFQHQQSTVAVMVDFAAAFDRVWRKRLILKLEQWGVCGNMLHFIKSFLSQRFIRVRYDQEVSSFRQTREGVPQGSVLSPTLFNVMINDLVSEIESKILGLNVALYADDLLIWATSRSMPALEECVNKALKLLDYWAEENEMEVNHLKTNYQVFTLSTKPVPIVLKYRGFELKKTDSAVYLGVKLDNRLTWNKHLDNAAERGAGRLKLLNRLTGATWGPSQDLLTMTYKTYVRPAMMYGCEIAITASDSAKQKVEKVQNTALRTITGAAQSTPISAMQCQTGVEPISARIDQDALVLYERLQRNNLQYWNDYIKPSIRLPTQKNFTHAVETLAQELHLDIGNREAYATNDYLQPFDYELSLVGGVSKNCAIPSELRAAALETINTRYPDPQWLHVYTDGSADGALKNGGAGVYSSKFTVSAPVGQKASSYDGEVNAILLALEEIINRTEAKSVILIDSQSAILSLGNAKLANVAAATKRCLKIRHQIVQQGRYVFLQWLPSHCGIRGNEIADRMAKEGSAMEQPETPTPFQTSKRFIAAAIASRTMDGHAEEAKGKNWERLTQRGGKIPATLPRRDAVAQFRLTTGHDFLQMHLHRIGVVESPNCPLCNSGERMNAAHLLNCKELDMIREENESKTLVERYWAARRRMAQIPATGVG